MKVIINGSRTCNDYEKIKNTMDNISREKTIKEVVCGGARGADTLGEQWAKERGIAVKYFPAQWNMYGKSAGFIRNQQMCDYADYIVSFWDGKSKGTKHAFDYMRKLGKHGEVYIVK